MGITNLIYRFIVYPFIFLFNGVDVYGKLRRIRKFEKNNFEDIDKIQEQKLAGLFADKYGGSSLPQSVQLDKLPITTKNDLRLRGCGNSSENLGKHIVRMTAGTTGVPLTVLVNRDAWAWQLATRYFLFGWHGVKIGDREARFWGRPLNGYRNKFKNLLLNRKVFTFCAENNEQLLNEYSQLLSYRPDYIYGYSSLILQAAILCNTYKLEKPKIKAIFCTAELINSNQKSFIESVFNCKVFTEYGCTESDILAFECEYGNLHVIAYNIILEVDDNLGVIYTDLNNNIAHIIRYNIGDSALIDDKIICDCGRKLPVITALNGRNIDQVFSLDDGSTIHAVSFAYLLEDLVGNGYQILQFKIVYENKKLIFFINLCGDADDFNLELCHGLDEILKGRVSYSVVYGAIQNVKNTKYSYFECKDV